MLFGSGELRIALVREVSRKYGETMKVKVIVMPKATVLDPQGNAVRDAMRHLGMPEVRSVRIGKYMEIDVDGKNGDLEARLHGLCRDLLSNPVIEDYDLRRSEAEDSGGASRSPSGNRDATAGRAATARQQDVGSQKQKGRDT
jgi:phosphoribosylformylglycinamidine synthase subunit PurS